LTQSAEMTFSLVPVAIVLFLCGPLIHEADAVQKMIHRKLQEECEGTDAFYCKNIPEEWKETVCSVEITGKPCPQTCCGLGGGGGEPTCEGKDKGLPTNIGNAKCKDLKKALFLCNFPLDGKLIKEYCCKTCKKKNEKCENVRKFRATKSNSNKKMGCRTIFKKNKCEKLFNQIPLKNFCAGSCGLCDEPTASPTQYPTVTPTMSSPPTVSTTSAPSDQCVDDPDFSLALGFMDCEWAGKYKSRCALPADVFNFFGPTIADFCCASCE